MEPRRGDILLYSGRSPVSHAIKKVIGCEWSHGAWVLDAGAETILESDWRGVRVSKNKYAKNRTKILRINAPIIDVERAVTHAESQTGGKYDHKALFGMLWLFLTFQRENKEPWQRHKAWFCFELISVPLARFGFIFNNKIPPRGITSKEMISCAKVRSIDQ